SGGSLYTMRPDGTDLRLVVPQAVGGDWSPEGSRIAFGDTAGTGIVDASGRHLHWISSLAFAAWSPDGGWGAVHAAARIEVVRPGGGRPRLVVEAGSIDSVAWRPS